MSVAATTASTATTATTATTAVVGGGDTAVVAGGRL